jgi:glycosyltransferase involved in cell wall biosynthesis
MSMSRVLLLSAEYPPDTGGVGDYTRRLGQALIEQGATVQVATVQAGRLVLLDPAEQQSARILHQISRRRPWNWAIWQDVIAALDAVQPQILHIQYQTGAYGMHPAINFLPWRLRALLPQPAICVTFHDLLEPYLFPKAGRLRRYVNLRLARDCDGVVCTNSADAAMLGRLVDTTGGRIPIGSNIPGIPPEHYDRSGWRHSHGLAADSFLIVFFGLMSASKGLDTLLAALDHLPLDLNWRLAIVGGGAHTRYDQRYAANVRQQIARSNWAGRISITGDIPEQDVSGWLLAADAVALPFRDGASYRRGSLLAALSHGCPIISTRPVATQDDEPALEAGRHLLAVAPGDSRGLAAALQQLAAEPELAARLGTNAECLAKHFSWATIARQHQAFYARIVPAIPVAMIERNRYNGGRYHS